MLRQHLWQQLRQFWRRWRRERPQLSERTGSTQHTPRLRQRLRLGLRSSHPRIRSVAAPAVKPCRTRMHTSENEAEAVMTDAWERSQGSARTA